MSLRISSVLVLGVAAVTLATCGGDDRSPQPDRDVAAPGAANSPPTQVAGPAALQCAPDGAAAFSASCTVEEREIDDETILIVRHADGEFHRFIALADGAGLEVADGALNLQQTLRENILEVTLGDDRYRFQTRAS